MIRVSKRTYIYVSHGHKWWALFAIWSIDFVGFEYFSGQVESTWKHDVGVLFEANTTLYLQL